MHKFESMNVIILKGGANSIGRIAAESRKKHKHDDTAKAKRFFNIIVDIPWLFPSVKNVNVIDDRSEVDELTRSEGCVFSQIFISKSFIIPCFMRSFGHFDKQGKINALFEQGQNVQRLVAPPYALEDTNSWLNLVRVKKIVHSL